ncbi:unnamed protein product [Mytilus coruscus]|uniref:Uncharacterized protein n=1 Tax=Mytilus coruscus TaxID=42192 RepID=A0A6J8BFR6_MYTCO|nr:unnamed protein product [Mytilus coruscus]
MQYAIDNRDPPPPPPIIQSINIHHIRKNNHWLTSVYEPAASQIYIYDFLTMPSTMQELTQQLELLYSNCRNVQFVPKECNKRKGKRQPELQQKRIRREIHDFKQMETNHKRTKREKPDFKLKELKQKRTKRKSPDFKFETEKNQRKALILS